MFYPELLNITGMRNQISEVVHLKHLGRDVGGFSSPDGYLGIAREIGRSAAIGMPHTYVKRRGNGNLAVYAETLFAKEHSYKDGIFMAVMSCGHHGILLTLFGAHKSYWDRDNPQLI